jgi:hypothetical protein
LEVTPDRRVVWKCSYLVGSIPYRIYRAYRVPSQWLPENPRGYLPWIPQGCIDNDNDGYGNPASALCTYPDLDCDDSNADVNPGAQEVCTNGVDDDCDLDVDCDDADCVSDPSCDPCTPNPCTTPPAPACDADGITLHDHVSPGNCTDVGGTAGCDYPPLDTDCSVTGQICVTNACVDP